MTLIKICGITNLDDALVAISAGADALGFNFFERSPRYIEPSNARRIMAQLTKPVLKVGVFVNMKTPQLVDEIAREAGLDAVQLHGSESPEFCKSLKHYFVIKTISIGPEFDITSARRYGTDAIMVDAFDKTLHGGTGRVVDWAIARRVRDVVPKLILAGGLSPENISDAINSVKPFAVDACSALETAPGKKDADRVRLFIELARSVKP